MEIKLDSKALAALIEADPEFRLVLQSAVLANVASRYVKGVPEEITKIVRDQADRERKSLMETFGRYESNGSWTSQFQLGPSLSNDIKKAVRASAASEIKQLECEAVNQATAGIDNYIQRQLQWHIDKVLPVETAKIVQEKVQEIMRGISINTNTAT